jgi:hypothetical protein
LSAARAVVFTILALALALVVVSAFGGVGVGSFVLLVSLAVLGFALWRRSRSND